MNFYKRTALAALVMGFSGAALALPSRSGIYLFHMKSRYKVRHGCPTESGGKYGDRGQREPIHKSHSLH